MSKEARLQSSPPRLLMGAALLFWGGMIGYPVVGLLCAFLVEGRAWFSVRWGFGERAFTRAWGVCLALLTLTFVWSWMEGMGVLNLFRLLSWWPVFFLPLILVQCYGTSEFMLLNTFSMFARKKMHHDRKLGRTVNPVKIHFGNVYLTLVLMSSALGEGSRDIYFGGLCLFAALAFFFSGKTGRQRPFAWTVSIALTGVIGLAGAIMLDLAYQYIDRGSFHFRGSRTFPGQSMTAIGRVGELKLSHKIHWRVQVEGGGAPSFYREAVFNKYGQGLWRHEPWDGTTSEEDFDRPMASRGDQGDQDYRFVFDRRDLDLDRAGSRKMVFTGSLEIPGPTPIPLPSGVGLIRGLQADGIDYNSLGTVVVENPDYGITRFEAYQLGESRNEKAAVPVSDFQIPEGEKEAIRETVDKLGLRGLPEREILARLKLFFETDFQYSLYHRSLEHIGPSARRSMATFLNETKRGHCEYFATAAVLLLREAGVPARYAVGFAATEKGRKGEWLLRGQHGHAWCRVYLGGQAGDGVEGEWSGGRWADFDPTPGTWLAMEGGVPWEQKIVDWWQRSRQDLLIWRSGAENRHRVSWGMGIVGAVFLAYILIRLWRSRLQQGKGRTGARMRGGGDLPPSPLTALSKSAEALLGPRPPGRPLADWIQELANLKPTLEPTLRRAVHFHWKARFDPLGLEEEEDREFDALCRGLKRELRKKG